ncbi:MAG TPA: FtsW/RodA/SpoVE family cell cycle protein, partial [Acidimicrobiales bacterium]|nr:FtsW/RodA/SpoVE family cell cycle protein [Acidimicrobiales bacterium]
HHCRHRLLGDDLDHRDLGHTGTGGDNHHRQRGLMALTTAPPPSPSATAAVPRGRAVSPAWQHVDLLLIAASAAVTAIGVLMVYSTTRVPLAASGFSPQSYMDKQATYAGIAFAAFVVTVLFDYKRYLSWAPVLYIGSILLLLATLAIGRTTLGATSWIQVGSIEVEPSEIVKVTFIISLAALLASRKGNISFRLLLLVLVLSLPPFLLVYKQDALGSAMVLAVVLVGMLLMAGTKGRHMVVLALLAVIAIGGVTQTGVLKQYQKDRLVTFLEAPSGVGSGNAANNTYAAGLEYNLDQSKAAIADGGIEGRGLFKGPETNLSYVPNQDTDFIFTAMAEQFGFVGSVVLLALFAIIVWRSWRAAVLSRDLAGTLICVGVLSMLMFQVFENVGMTMGIMPVAGITLPLMSYGGSSMVVDWVAIGLVANVGMRRFS